MMGLVLIFVGSCDSYLVPASRNNNRCTTGTNAYGHTLVPLNPPRSGFLLLGQYMPPDNPNNALGRYPRRRRSSQPCPKAELRQPHGNDRLSQLRIRAASRREMPEMLDAVFLLPKGKLGAGRTACHAGDRSAGKAATGIFSPRVSRLALGFSGFSDPGSRAYPAPCATSSGCVRPASGRACRSENQFIAERDFAWVAPRTAPR
jgi:hypothetical protein